MVLFCLAMLGVFSTLNSLCFAQLAPVMEPVSPQFHVDVSGAELPVYVTRICNLSAEDRKAIWSRATKRGHIADITFRDITPVTPEAPNSTAVLTGSDAAHAINGVQFDHVVIGGEPLHPSDLTKNSFVQNVTLAP